MKNELIIRVEDPELLNEAVEAMRELQQRYELEAANFAFLGDIGKGLAQERIEKARTAERLFAFFAGV